MQKRANMGRTAVMLFLKLKTYKMFRFQIGGDSTNNFSSSENERERERERERQRKRQRETETKTETEREREYDIILLTYGENDFCIFITSVQKLYSVNILELLEYT